MDSDNCAGSDGGRSLDVFQCGVFHGLLKALRLRDRRTVEHSLRVVTYMLLVAEQMQIDQCLMAEIALGAALHDVGKLGIADAILFKPGRLTPSEHAIIKQHPVIGCVMLQDCSPHFPVMLDLVRHHHERHDGEGYPDGLAGRQIRIWTRALIVVDAFDAMTSLRSYKATFSIKEARTEIMSLRGQQFSPETADIFLDLDPAVLEAVRCGELQHLSCVMTAAGVQSDHGFRFAALEPLWKSG